MARQTLEKLTTGSFIGAGAGTMYGVIECVQYNSILGEAGEWSERIAIVASDGGLGFAFGFVGSAVLMAGGSYFRKKIGNIILPR
tara:strand:- start:1910 stop:2164 length:255 start_codon:yes stop_codon:yes gene_type:complete